MDYREFLTQEAGALLDRTTQFFLTFLVNQMTSEDGLSGESWDEAHGFPFIEFNPSWVLIKRHATFKDGKCFLPESYDF